MIAEVGEKEYDLLASKLNVPDFVSCGDEISGLDRVVIWLERNGPPP